MTRDVGLGFCRITYCPYAVLALCTTYIRLFCSEPWAWASRLCSCSQVNMCLCEIAKTWNEAQLGSRCWLAELWLASHHIIKLQQSLSRQIHLHSAQVKFKKNYVEKTLEELVIKLRNYKLDVGNGTSIKIYLSQSKNFNLPKYCQTEIISLNEKYLFFCFQTKCVQFQLWNRFHIKLISIYLEVLDNSWNKRKPWEVSIDYSLYTTVKIFSDAKNFDLIKKNSISNQINKSFVYLKYFWKINIVPLLVK